MRWTSKHYQRLIAVVLFAVTAGFSQTALAAIPSLSATTIYWDVQNVESSVKATNALLGATIDSENGEAISARGIVWNYCSVNANPLITDSNVWPVPGTSIGDFSDTVTFPVGPAQICFKGYATNASGTGYSGIASFWSEPDAAVPPTVDAPIATANYFDLTVNYTVPVTSDGVLVVVRQSYSNDVAPYDGTEYTANSSIGDGDTIVPGCLFYCNYVVANVTTSGSVTITGLKEGVDHYFAVYSYKGSGTGISGINYVQTINSTLETTTVVPIEGTSHNELFIAADSTYDPSDGSGTPGTMTSNDCANCHGSHHTSQHLPRDVAMYDFCWTCHQSGQVAANKSDIGLHLPDGRVDCGTCHSMHSFRTEELYSDATAHGGGKNFNLSFVRTNMSKYVNPADYPPPDGGGTLSALDNTLFQTRPDHFAFSAAPYNGVCQTCHTTPAVNHHYQTGTDDHQIGNDCATCHSHKLPGKFNAFSAGHLSDFGSDADCTGCHDTTDGVMNGVHGDGIIATCSLCHNGNPTRDNEKLGDSIATKSPTGDARLADGAAAANSWTTQTCITCHKHTIDITGFHGITIGDVTQYHQLSSDNTSGYDCERCHSTNKANKQLWTHMSADTVAQCSVACHLNITPSGASGIVAKQVIDDVTFNYPEPNPNDSKCEDCHAQKGDFKRHGMDDDDSVADGIDNANGPGGTTGLVTHNNLGSSIGSWADSGGTIPSTRAAGYSGKINTTNALIDDDYNCADCHDDERTDFTTLEALRVHTYNQGSGNGNCLTCHTASMVADEINAGKGVSGTTVTCEDCHSIANGNGPSGEKMYQYDGVRHHRTPHAQAGNCTQCHADPRPPDLSGEPGFAGTAAINDGSDSDGIPWNDGFDDDFNINNPNPIPIQMGCRLCHTNYETYTIDVQAEIDTDWNTNELPDHHGYNKYPPAHGLTVYADNFDARNTTLTYRIQDSSYDIRGAQQVSQTSIASHRIDAVDGSSKIDVYNFGACFACHTVQIRHAAPIPAVDYDTPIQGTSTSARNTHPFDTLRYAPGRSVFNDFRGTSGDAWNNHRKPNQWLRPNDWGGRGRDVFQGATPWWGSITSSTVNVPVDTNVNQLENLTGTTSISSYPIRVFTTGPAAPVIDYITITLAEWDGTDLTVHATSTETPGGSGTALTFDYNGSTDNTMTWSTDHWEGTITSGYDEWVTVKSSNGSGGQARRFVIDNSNVPTTAVDDSYTVALNTIALLDVLDNDAGVNNTVISTDDTNLNPNCSTLVAGGGAYVTINCVSTTGAMGTFDYVVQGDLNSDTGRVTITTIVNQAPTITINQPDGVGDTGTRGGSFTIDYDADDPDGDSISVDFYYETDGDGSGGTPIASCQNLTAKGTGLTCAWTNLPDPDSYYVYGIADDSIDTTTGISSGTVTVSIQPVILNGSWDIVSDTTAGGTITNAYSAPAGTNRMLIVIATHEDSGSETIVSATYNGSPVNHITSQASGNQYVWIGYQLLATGGAIASTNVQATFSNTVSASRLAVATYDYANQTAPTNYNQQATTNNPSISVTNVDGGRVIYGVNFNNTSTITPPTGWTEHDDTTVSTGGMGGVSYRMGVAERNSTTAGSVTVNPTSGANSNPTVIVGVSIDPL